MKNTPNKTVFSLIFSVFLLLNLNLTILRSLRTTLTVVDLGHGAYSIPLYELFGAMPAAFLMTWGLTRLINRYSIQKVFITTLGFFLAFYATFNFVIYPFLLSIKGLGSYWEWPLQLGAIAFYVVTELWKPALSTVLFWGLLNQCIPLEEAKKTYAPLMLAGSLGSIIAGPILTFCTSGTVWASSLNVLMFVVLMIGLLTLVLFRKLLEALKIPDVFYQKHQKNNLTLTESLKFSIHDPQIRLLSWIVIADYVAYSLAEVIFLDLLHLKFPLALDYCNYLGHLAFWSGATTLVCSFFVTPWLLKNYRWVCAALITPMCLLLTEGAFFIVLRISPHNTWIFEWSESEWITLLIMIGSIQFCVGRATKYSLFDASKELAYVFMPDYKKMKGKLIVDGICSRLGRGGASILSMGLINLAGGVLASSFFTGFIALAMVTSWIACTFRLGKLIDPKADKGLVIKI